MANATILYWNINNFTDNRISAGSKRKRDEDEDYMAAPPGPEHLLMMLTTFCLNSDAMGVIQELDFIVVVEVYNRIGDAVEGDLVDGSGLLGCLSLLNALRNLPPPLPSTWALVPPVVTGDEGQREAIAVFYRTDRWYFLGPEARAYPPLLVGAVLPFPARPIPVGYPYRGGLSEDSSAGQWEFRVPAPPLAPPGAPINFPFADNRKPWLTTFGRIPVPPAMPTLLVRLMSIHTKPNGIGVGTPD